ncbi:MAG: rod shape-determining protein [bacterium]|nr:rod shape-determining protein [bacterium]
MFRPFLSFFSHDLAIDLGTANTLVYLKDRGVVIDEPTVVAMRRDTGAVMAVGLEAKIMLGRTPEAIRALRPMSDGVIADFEVTERMLKYFITKSHGRRFFVHPRVLVCVPSGITEVEKRAVRDSATHAGAREVLMIYEPMAAAVGAGLPVHEPVGNIIIDIGGGTTEMAVISLSGIVTHTSIRIGGDEMDVAIDKYLRKTYNLLVGEQTAERIKLQIGSAFPLEKKETMDIRGRDIVEGVPRTLSVTSTEIREALSEPVSAILRAVHRTLEQTPPELAADIVDRGIYMTGGGSMLRGLSELLHRETDLTIHLVDNPLTTVVAGAGKVLENPEAFHKVILKENRR